MPAADPDAVRAERAWAYENPRPEVQALVPIEARRILDLGCSSGALGAALKVRQGCEVVGVELDAAYAADARARLDEVVEDDVETLDPAPLGRFDCLIAGDVLEHLRDPWTALARFAALLEPGGTAVVSLPNVRYWETFWQVGWKGTWPRRAEGIFDRTHLRWFTLADAYELMDGAGLEVATVSRQMRLRPAGSKWDRHVRLLERTPLRSFFTFQYVIAGRRR
jgi:methionine biosynthesis protein MetW